MGGLADVWVNNTCIVQDQARAFAFNDCNEKAPLDGSIPRFAGNTYLSAAGGYAMSCGKAVWDLPAAQALGVDVGSTTGPLPSVAEIVAAAHALLEF